MEKLFTEWMYFKEKLHALFSRSPKVHEGDIWWASLGENIGNEINGKSKKFSRPVIVFKKLSKEIFLIIPITTKQKEGTWYVSFVHRSTNEVACLHQIRMIDYRRLLSNMGEMDRFDFRRVQEGFRKLYA